MHRDRFAGQLFMLRNAVVFPWESVDQLLHEHGARDLGDPITPGTGAWHFRHIVEIFRLHARTTMLGLGGSLEDVNRRIPSPEDDIPAKPSEARDALLTDIDAFASFIEDQSDASLSQDFVYGSSTNLERMLVCMSVHITWHAAAVHYWVKWRA